MSQDDNELTAEMTAISQQVRDLMVKLRSRRGVNQLWATIGEMEVETGLMSIRRALDGELRG